MNLDHPVLSSLLPVVLLIAIGVVAGKARLVRGEGVRDLSNLVFLVLTQALLFRTMSAVHIERLDFKSVALYYAVAGGLFIALLLIQGLNSRSAVLALAAIFSNTLMIGVPLVSLAYGEAGLVQLFTLISMHALVLLTFATVVLELLVAHEDARAGRTERRHLLLTVGQAVKNAVIHPVPLPIIAGLLYAQTGWGLHPVVDRPLKLLGDAFGPVALVRAGSTAVQLRFVVTSEGVAYVFLSNEESDVEDVLAQNSAGAAISAEVDLTVPHVYLLDVRPMQHVRLHIDYATEAAIDVEWPFSGTLRALPANVPAGAVLAFGSLDEDTGVRCSFSFFRGGIGRGYDFRAGLAVPETDVSTFVYGSLASLLVDVTDED